MRGIILTLAAASLVLAGPAEAQSRLQKFNPFNKAPRPAPLTTFMPERGFEEWVAANLDIRSFNSSLDNRRESYQARLREVGYEPMPQGPRRRGAPVTVGMTSADGDIILSLFERGDANHDGIEDVVVCFDDSLKSGRYHKVQALLAQKYTASGPLVALDVRVTHPLCREN